MKFEKLLLNMLGSVMLVTLMSACPKNDGKTMVEINTEFGDMTVLLYDETPLHRDNFLKLVNEGFYDSLLFHRIIPSFMIQGGDPDSKKAPPGARLGVGGPGYTVPAEFMPQFYHKKGALAAARQPDEVNPAKASSGSQFYIVMGSIKTDQELNMLVSGMKKNFTDEQRQTYMTVGGTPQLDQDYTIFGEVVEGLEVIDLIVSAARDQFNRPTSDIRMVMRVTKSGYLTEKK